MQLDVRLGAAAALVPIGARLADIGSDHAYLPIALCLENKIECALASDINEGPVAAAVANIRKNGLGDRIMAVRADGLDKTLDFAPDCITVLGMGGELIVSILDKAPWVKNENITLVLQPMTHPEILRRSLLQNGYSIIDERLAREEKIYARSLGLP
jgi:tRNA (adenine22-N1)-methyltransferase